MVGIEERGATHALLRTRNEQTLLLVIVLEVGSRMVNRISLDVYGDFGVLRKQVGRTDEEAARLGRDDDLAFIIDSHLGKRVALTGTENGGTVHGKTAHIIYVFVEVFHWQGSLKTSETRVGGLFFGGGQYRLILHAPEHRLREKLGVVEQGVVIHHSREPQVNIIVTQLGIDTRIQPRTIPRDCATFGLKLQFVREIATVHPAYH